MQLQTDFKNCVVLHFLNPLNYALSAVTTLFDCQCSDNGYIRGSYEAGLGEIDYKLRGFEEITV